MLAFRYLCRLFSMMLDNRLNRLAVFCRTFTDQLIVPEIVAHAISREDLRRHQTRADVSAVIAQDEFVKPRFSRGPVFLCRHKDRFTRRAFWAAKNKGVDAIAFEHLDRG